MNVLGKSHLDRMHHVLIKAKRLPADATPTITDSSWLVGALARRQLVLVGVSW